MLRSRILEIEGVAAISAGINDHQIMRPHGKDHPMRNRTLLKPYRNRIISWALEKTKNVLYTEQNIHNVVKWILSHLLFVDCVQLFSLEKNNEEYPSGHSVIIRTGFHNYDLNHRIVMLHINRAPFASRRYII